MLMTLPPTAPRSMSTTPTTPPQVSYLISHVEAGLLSASQTYRHHSTLFCLLAGDGIPSPSGSYQPRWDSFFRHVTVLIYQ